MKLSDLMASHTPNPDFAGFTTADDMVLAINLTTPTATTPDDYLVAQQGITEHSGTLEAQTQDSQYIRTGQVTIKTGTARNINVTGDRYVGDEFQDALLAHALKYGTGQAVIKEYVYFNLLTGKGESGSLSIVIEDDPAGAAGENASFTATLTSTTAPAEYTYTPSGGGG